MPYSIADIPAALAKISYRPRLHGEVRAEAYPASGVVDTQAVGANDAQVALPGYLHQPVLQFNAVRLTGLGIAG